MGLEGCEDTRRKLIELHVESAKKRLSAQTGLLHLFYDVPGALEQSTIPLLENMFFVLGLFRTRLSDPILEAKQLMEKLLPFEVEGNFPIYMHQYPACRDRSLSLHMLPVLHYLLTDYRQVLGEELTKKLEGLSHRIVARGKEISQQKNLPFGAEVKLAAFTKSLTPRNPSSSQEWGEYLIALHMVRNESWTEEEIRKAASLWNDSLGIYVGERGAHPQDGCFPKATALDLFMALQTGAFSKSVLSHNTLLLSASLVHAFEQGDLLFHSKPLAVLAAADPKQPVSLFWKENAALRSLAVEIVGGSCKMQKTEYGIDLVFTYPEDMPSDEENCEIALYIDANEKMSLLVNGSQASTFRLGQETKVETVTSSLELKFSLVEGDGKFFGHVSKGNRPSQTRKDIFEAFDWKIGLRTIQRSAECKMRLSLVLPTFIVVHVNSLSLT